MQVFLNVTLSGGILPSTIASPSVGLLLRLSVACYLGVSPAAVAFTAVTTTAPGVVGLDLATNDAVNLQPGDCSAVRAPLRTRLQRQLDSSTAATTTAFLAVHACREASTSAGDLSALGALLASLVASTNSSSAALSPFLDAVARDSGISRTALAPIVAVGLAGSSANSAPAANSATSGNSPASVLAVSLSVVGLLLLIALCIVCLCFALRRRKRQREEARKKLPICPPALHGVNPMHPVDNCRQAVSLLATVDPVASEPDLLLTPGAVMLPWKGNPAFKPASETTARRRAPPMPPRHSFTLRGPASAGRDGGFSQVDPFLGTNPLRSPMSYRPQGRPAAPPDPSHSSSAEDARAGSTLRRGRDAVPGLPPPLQPPTPAHVDTGAFVGENPLRKRGAAAPLSPLSSRGDATVPQLRIGSIANVKSSPLDALRVAPGGAVEFTGENPLRRTGLGGHSGGPPAALY